MSSIPENVIIATSSPGFIRLDEELITLRNLLFTLFLFTAYRETFWLTIKPNLLSFRPFFTNFKAKKLPLAPFPCLKTFSKSFFFFSRFVLGNILDTKLFSPLSPSIFYNSPAGSGFFSSHKTVRSGPFFLLGLVSKTHVV